MPPSPARPRAWSSRLGLWLVLSLVAANLAVIAVAGVTLNASLQRHHRQAAVTTRNLADILEQNLSGHIRLLDFTLLQILDDPRFTGIPNPTPEALGALLEHPRSRLPLLNALRVTDAEGHVIGGTGVQHQIPGGIADRTYYQALRADPDLGLVISSPLVSRFDGALSLIFARARRGPGGRFDGILYAVVPVDAFTRTLGIVDIGPRGSIAVRDGEHRLITRVPADPHLEARVGGRTDTPAYLAIVRSGQKVGTFRTASPTDGIHRTWTVRQVADHPLWLVVGLAEADYLVPWRHEAQKSGATVLGSLVFSLGMGSLLLRAWGRQRAGQAEQARLVEDLTQALVEVKALKGMLPICSGCKKIRDDQGYWSQIETYISAHTDATFTHGLCPDCARTYFPDLPSRRPPGMDEHSGPA